MSVEEHKIAEVIPAANLPRELASFWSYRVPSEMQPRILIGDVVKIPFGKKEILGMINSFSEEKETAFKLKEVKEIVSDLRVSEKQMEIARFISAYYFTPMGLVMKTLLPEETRRAARTEMKLSPSPEVDDCAEDLKDQIKKDLENYDRLLLLHSLRSDRHNLYLDIIEKQDEKSQTLLMLPEYFDIYSIAQFYIGHFGADKVAILGSGITKNQYFAEWQKVKSGDARLIISTRQGIFAPFGRLGLIIVDEEHNSSYKQWDQNPRYHAVRAAIELTKIHQAKIILASNSPTLESYHLTKQDFHLTNIYTNPTKRPQIADFETERRGGNYTFVSEKLKEELLDTIYKKKQALIFIPRLGEKTVYQCKDCGHIAECETCQSPLIGYRGKLYCPRCKQLYDALTACPKCQGQNIDSFGGGSERIFEEIKTIFENKNIRIVKLDSSEEAAGSRNQKICADFQEGRIDILIGTQMVWKNWQTKRLELIGVIFPEIIFNAPGFRSRERTRYFLAKAYAFSQEKTVIFETYKPEHKYFDEIRKKSGQEFLEEELLSRDSGISRIKYPPLGKLIKLIYKNPSASACEKEARWQYKILKEAIFNLESADTFEVMPPFAAQNYRSGGKYRWHIILKYSNDLSLERRDLILKNVKKDWIIDVDPDEIL